MKKLTLFYMTCLTWLVPSFVFASNTTTYEYEKVLDALAKSFTGPVAYSISLIVIAGSGLVMAFADLQGGAKKLIQAACGCSVALFAAQLLGSLLKFNGALI